MPNPNQPQASPDGDPDVEKLVQAIQVIEPSANALLVMTVPRDELKQYARGMAKLACHVPIRLIVLPEGARLETYGDEDLANLGLMRITGSN